MVEASDPWPTELRLKPGGSALVIAFEDGAQFELSAELLRVTSPSAEAQGHHPADRKTVAGKSTVSIVSVAPVGHYAVKLTFSDGHDTGLFSWRFLRDLGETRDARWEAYLAELADKGLSR